MNRNSQIPPNEHKRTIVPIDVWEFNSPALLSQNKQTDLGLLAEALLYYDAVVVHLQTERQLEDLVAWCIERDHINTLLQLIYDGIIVFHRYSFLTSAMENQGVYSVVNVEEQADDEFFANRLINAATIKGLNTRKRSALFRAIRDHFIVTRVDGYDAPVEATQAVLQDPERCNVIMQAWVDDVYRELGKGRPPAVRCEIQHRDDNAWSILWNVNFATLGQMIGLDSPLRSNIPLFGEAHANKFLWTASQQGWDLYLGTAMSTLVRERLLEASQRSGRVRDVVEQLELRVDFPDIRHLVNHGDLHLNTVLTVRRKAERFRDWLQERGEKSSDDLIAYHNDVARATGLQRGIARSIKLLGHAGALGSYAYSSATHDHGMASALAGIGTSGALDLFLHVIANRFDREWKPVMFGDWLENQVGGDDRL